MIMVVKKKILLPPPFPNPFWTLSSNHFACHKVLQ
jgi:hypothetical protein